jgi:sterol desaturase/sphingolipid hydroxylase (fatty acid hydroxylase superfamily)
MAAGPSKPATRALPCKNPTRRMERYLQSMKEGYTGYWNYLVHEVGHPHWQNYFYWLTGISLVFFGLEVVRPWRAGQPKFRKDFWLDTFYMYFNYFLFSLLIFAGLSKVGVEFFQDLIGLFGLKNIEAVQVDNLPAWAQLLLLFVLADFIQWWTHRMLHRVGWLWEFHKVHHSVEQMGFQAHLRYHWMENVVYKVMQFVPLSMIGYDLQDLFAVYMFTTVVGHFNHSNITVSGRVTGGILGGLVGLAVATNAFETGLALPHWSLGVGIVAGAAVLGSLALGPAMRYVFNSPEMHIWHHSLDLPSDKPYGINFGLTLSCWDWIFRTAHMPHDGRDIRLGFPGMEWFPKGFLGQFVHGFGRRTKP